MVPLCCFKPYRQYQTCMSNGELWWVVLLLGIGGVGFCRWFVAKWY